MPCVANTSCFYDLSSDARPPAYVTLHIMIRSLGMLLNIIVMSIICSSQRLRATTHALIASLAASDLAYSATGVLTIAIATSKQRHISCVGVLSKTLSFIHTVSVTATYINLLLVSIERWMFIARPFAHQRLISTKRIRRGLAFAWIFPIAFHSDRFFLPLDLSLCVDHVKLGILFPCSHLIVSIILCAVYVHISVITRTVFSKYFFPPEMSVLRILYDVVDVG